MRKFTANYLVSDSGVFLKNGILIADDEGTAVQYIDTTGDLKEIAQLSFHNGILMAGFIFSKNYDSVLLSETENPLKSMVMLSVARSIRFSIQDLIELCKQVQYQFQDMKIPEIMNEISEVLLSNAGFVKENIPGIYILTGVYLPELHFTSRTKLKKIL